MCGEEGKVDVFTLRLSEVSCVSQASIRESVGENLQITVRFCLFFHTFK